MENEELQVTPQAKPPFKARFARVMKKIGLHLLDFVKGNYLMFAYIVASLLIELTGIAVTAGKFYMTEPCDPKWAAAPEFRSSIPTRLTSWKETGLSWGNPEEVTGLQTCVRDLVTKKVKLVNVVQVMLFRRILPCQRRDFNLWEFDPAQH